METQPKVVKKTTFSQSVSRVSLNFFPFIHKYAKTYTSTSEGYIYCAYMHTKYLLLFQQKTRIGWQEYKAGTSLLFQHFSFNKSIFLLVQQIWIKNKLSVVWRKREKQETIECCSQRSRTPTTLRMVRSHRFETLGNFWDPVDRSVSYRLRQGAIYVAGFARRSPNIGVRHPNSRLEVAWNSHDCTCMSLLKPFFIQYFYCTGYNLKILGKDPLIDDENATDDDDEERLYFCNLGEVEHELKLEGFGIWKCRPCIHTHALCKIPSIEGTDFRPTSGDCRLDSQRQSNCAEESPREIPGWVRNVE